MALSSELACRVRSRREALGLSQEELAIRVGYKDRSTIAKIESGVNDITQKKLLQFAEALQTTPAYLIGLTEDTIEINKEPDIPMDDELLDAELIRRLVQLTPSELEKVDSFVQGLLAAR